MKLFEVFIIAGLDIVFLKRRVISVSYTHLDVYKRQVLLNVVVHVIGAHIIQQRIRIRHTQSNTRSVLRDY